MPSSTYFLAINYNFLYNTIDKIFLKRIRNLSNSILMDAILEQFWGCSFQLSWIKREL